MNPVWPPWQEVATKPALTSNLFTWEAVGNCFKIDQRFCYLKKEEKKKKAKPTSHSVKTHLEQPEF